MAMSAWPALSHPWRRYEDPAANIKDFGVLWLDDYLDELVAPIHPSLLSERPAMAAFLRSCIVDYLHAAPTAAESTATQSTAAESTATKSIINRTDTTAVQV